MATKHALPNGNAEEKRPSKKTRLLDESEESEAEEQSSEGAELQINEEYARRFEHNKKREERHQLEDKYGRVSARLESADGSENDSSSDETEDEAGFLATGKADAEFEATLKALREKNPRIYDKQVRFYTETVEGGENDESAVNGTLKKEKPMTLHDYHRKNLLDVDVRTGEEDETPIPTYAEEQESLKHDLVAQMHATADSIEEQDPEDDDFLVRKESGPIEQPHQSRLTEADVAAADKDPETFLSNFLSSRSWAPNEESRFAPIESDDSGEEDRADAFEEAYNLRFENPALSNTNIISHSRSVVSKYSVRREETNPRKRAREKGSEKKREEKAERDTEKARLRKLRTEEMEEKVAKIKHAAGLRGKDTDLFEWAEILDKDWDDKRWNEEFENRFGDAYYAEADVGSDPERKKTKKPKKPKFDDDIDIKDLVPDFSEDDLNGATAADILSDPEDNEIDVKGKSKKDRQAERFERKKASRRDKRIIEQLVENSLPTDAELAANKKSKVNVPFQYRETSPTSFGLTALDILSATDAQLNQFVGLKKLTPFRDQEKKVKERKKISKKGRLREWRKEVFADAANVDRVTNVNEPENMSLKKADGEGKKKRNKKKGKKSDAGQGAAELL